MDKPIETHISKVRGALTTEAYAARLAVFITLPVVRTVAHWAAIAWLASILANITRLAVCTCWGERGGSDSGWMDGYTGCRGCSGIADPIDDFVITIDVINIAANAPHTCFTIGPTIYFVNLIYH